MASSKFNVYNVLSQMCTIGGVSEICEVFGLDPKKVAKFEQVENPQVKRDGSVTLSLILTEPASLAADSGVLNGRHLYAMPQMVDGTAVTLNKQWSDKLGSVELKALVDAGVQVVSNIGTVTLKGDIELVNKSVDKIKAVVIKKLLDSACRPRIGSSGNQSQGGGEGETNKSGQEACGVLPASSPATDLEDIHDKTPRKQNESETSRKSSSSKARLTETSTMHVKNDVDSKITSVQEDAIRAGRSASNTSTSSQSSASDNNTPSGNPIVADRGVSGHDDDERLSDDASLGNDKHQSGCSSASSSTRRDSEDAEHDATSLGDGISEGSRPSGANRGGWDSSGQAEKDYDESKIRRNTKPRYRIDRHVWDYIVFIAADKHSWYRKLTPSVCKHSTGQVEVDGEDADIDKLKKYCDRHSRQGGVITRRISVPKDCEFDVFKRQLQDLSQGRVLVDRFNGNEYCQLIGIKCEVEDLIASIEIQLPYRPTSQHYNMQEIRSTSSSGDMSNDVDVDYLTDLVDGMTLRHEEDSPKRRSLTLAANAHTENENEVSKTTSVQKEPSLSGRSISNASTDSQSSTSDEKNASDNPTVTDGRVPGHNDHERFRTDPNLGNDNLQPVSRRPSASSGTNNNIEDAEDNETSMNEGVSEYSRPSSVNRDVRDASGQVKKEYDESKISKCTKPKYFIDKQVWDYIMFINADDEHSWCRTLTPSACKDGTGQLEVDGDDADIDELKKCCDKLTRQDGVTTRRISVPKNCEFDVFKRELQNLSQGRVLVNRSNGMENCELIGIESEIEELIGSIDIRLPFSTNPDNETRKISTLMWNVNETQNTGGLISVNVDDTNNQDDSVSGNRKSLDVHNSSTASGGKSVSNSIGKQSTGSKGKKMDHDRVDTLFEKNTIDEPLWEFIKFSDPDSRWGSRLTASKSQADGGLQVELTGSADDIAILNRFCDRGRLRRALVTNVIALPTGYTVESIRAIVNNGHNGTVFVRSVNTPGYCELIGKKSDVQNACSKIDKHFPRNKAGDSDDSGKLFKQQTSAGPSGVSDDDTKSLSIPITYISTSDKLEFETPLSKVKVFVITGDIIKQPCEVIVSPADSNLRNNSGLAQKIVRAAGRDTIDECAKYISNYKRLSVSNVMKTGAGKLLPPCRCIIHACGPDNRHGSTVDECFDLLQTTFLKCFVSANDDIIAKSIAVPAISAGASGLSLDVVVRAAYSAVMAFDECLAKTPEKSMERIYFVNIDCKTTARMKKIFEQELSCSSSIRRAEGRRRPIQSANSALTSSTFGNATTRPSNSLPLSTSNLPDRLDKPEFETPKSKIKLSVVKGDILEQHYEVLVCPTDGTSSNISRLASALELKAGSNTKDEYDNYISMYGNMEVATVMDTGPGNLSPGVERIIYACAPYLKSGSSIRRCSDLLQTTFLNCFLYANDRLRARSIAVPSISPGGALGLSCDAVAGALSDSLLEFDEYLLNSRDKYLESICFADLNMAMTTCVNQRFRAKMSVCVPRTGSVRASDNPSLPSSAQSSTNSFTSKNNITPPSSLSPVPINAIVRSDNPEFATPKSKVKVVVVTEDILEQRCEVIVCPTVGSLSNATGLAKTIQSKAGPETMDDCNDYYEKHGYLDVTETMDTRPGRLDPPIKRIIYAHGPFMKTGSPMSHCSDLLRATFVKCFVHANDRLKARSIAVPAISSLGGVLPLPHNVVASAAGASLLELDEHLANVTDNHLDLICFANKDSELTASMLKEFQRKLSTATGRDADSVNRQPQASMQPSAASQPLTELEKRANELGFTVVDVPNDADSALNAIVHQLKDQEIYAYDASFLRQQTVAHLRQNPKLIDQGDLYRKHGGNVTLFLQRHSVTGNHFEKSMITGVAEVLQKEIRVFHENGQMYTFTPSLLLGQHLTLGVDSKLHYVSFRRASGSQTTDNPSQTTDEHENKVGKGNRTDNDAHQGNKIADKNSQPHASQTTATSSRPSCAICMDGIQNPKTLRCGHVFCTDCIDQHFEYQMKCPCCGEIFGELKGDQPKGGTMRVSTEYSSLEGYRGCGRIVISYYIRDGIQQANHPNPGRPYKGAHRTAYLPNNAEGQEICALLRRAFDAGLIFTVGRSTTSGQEDVVTWNDIHHKTKPTGPYGYPDPNYLARVRDELAAKGITSATASSTTSGSAAAANHATNSSTNCPPSTSSNYSASSSTSTTSAGAMSKSTAEVDVGRMTTRSMSAVNSCTASTNTTTPHRGSTTESSVTYVSSGPLTMHVSDASGSTIDRSDGSSSRPCVIGEPVAERLKKFQTHSDE